jgi:hypothetical protein
LPCGVADGSDLRVLTIEFGESDIFFAGYGYFDGDGSGRDSGRWAGTCDTLGGDGGSAFG